MARKCKWNLVHSHISYKISDIHKLLGYHGQTIRGWIKEDGLEAFELEGEFYIYGAVLKAFLKARMRTNKRKLEFTEFRCGKCKTIATPLENKIIKIETGKGGSLLTFAICVKCRNKMNRPYKANLFEELSRKFTISLEGETALYNTSPCSKNTHIKKKTKPPVSEPSEIMEKPIQLSLFNDYET